MGQEQQEVTSPRNDVERKILQLRETVKDIIHLNGPLDDDLYLLRYLKARDMDVGKAAKMLKNSAKWRKENDIDSLAEKSFPEGITALPIYVEALTKDGIAVASIHAGRVDLRSLLEQYGKDGSVRFLTQVLIQGERLVLACNRKKLGDAPLAENAVEGAMCLVTFEDFNPWQINSIKAVQTVVESCKIFVNHFPGLVSRICFVNCSPTSSVALKIIRSILDGPDLKIEVFGSGDEGWKPFIHDLVPTHLLRHYFGGTKAEEVVKRTRFIEEEDLQSLLAGTA